MLDYLGQLVEIRVLKTLLVGTQKEEHSGENPYCLREDLSHHK